MRLHGNHSFSLVLPPSFHLMEAFQTITDIFQRTHLVGTQRSRFEGWKA